VQKKILFVINPISGGVDKEPLINQIDNWVKQEQLDHKVFKTSGKNDLQQLKEAMKAFHPETVVAVGGDGTALLVGEAIMHTSVYMGILPAGSANGLAKHFEIPKNTKAALATLKSKKTIKADMLCFNDTLHALHISDLGLNARLVKHFSESENRGFLSYADGVLEEINDLETFSMHLTADGKEYAEEGIMLAIANANRYGTGALLNKVGKIDDGKMELCVLKHLDLGNIALHFLDFVDKHADYMEVIQCTKAHIKLQKPITFQVDGELQPDATEVKVEVIPGCLNIRIPEPQPGILDRLFSDD
jgi:YegS/Rv2252/BmrU family lipid kinase